MHTFAAGFLFSMNISRKEFCIVSAKTNGRCFYCNKWGEEVDHFFPRSKWDEWIPDWCNTKKGADTLDNLFLACKDCNRGEHSKHPAEFNISNRPNNAWESIIFSRSYRANMRVGLVKKDKESKEFYFNLAFYS
jgi:hypothetical protein